VLEAEGDGGGGMDALVLDLVTRAGIFDIRLVNRKRERENRLFLSLTSPFSLLSLISFEIAPDALLVPD